ncbi:MAG: family 2 glycosyl transferase [Ktedonobacter sp. 13_1_20CM_4_53_11]|nr:MAG: family 2 glycosyl transferase [Ktedonobacter sp. 13_1_20CM_4_53_11]
MSETTRDISVIICAYTEKRWDDLVAAVESVRQQTLKFDEIIIVIDHNPILLKKVQDHIAGVCVVENTETQGLSGSRNSGIAVAKGEIIVFLDDDAVATSDWLMFLKEAFSDPQILAAGGPVIPLWLDSEPAWLPEEFYWVVGCTYRGTPQTAQLIRNPIGANMSFKREVFDIVGGFRSEIGRVGTRPLGCEETELCIRARQHWPEKGILYQPEAIVYHRVPASRTSWRYFFSRCYAEGLSKAFVSQYVGVKDSLASERIYIFRTLPQGVVRGLIDVFLYHDLNGFARAGVIITGLAATTAGYFGGSIFFRVSKSERDFATEAVFRRNSKASQSLTARVRS